MALPVNPQSIVKNLSARGAAEKRFEIVEFILFTIYFVVPHK